MTTTYGIISDAHSINPRALYHAAAVLKYEEADILILNGDISGERSGIKPQDYLANALNAAAQTGLLTYVLAGSHEEAATFAPVVEHFSQKYPQIKNALHTPAVQASDHNLVFQPGCDAPPGHVGFNGYLWTNDPDAALPEGAKGQLLNLNDLRKQIADPEKTLFVSHVPARTPVLATGVDFADFYVLTETKQVNGNTLRAGTILPAVANVQPYLDAGLPFIRQQKNAGNEFLRELMKELGISKAISGHFHESAGRAHNILGNKLDDETFTETLYCNASHLDVGLVGLVTVDGTRAVYESIDLRKYR